MVRKTSKYLEIFNELRQKIEANAIQSGTYLASEKELMKTYNVSRDTVRKSLNMLLEIGLIQKIAGKGSLVLDTNQIAFPINGIYSFKELSETISGVVETEVYALNIIQSTLELEKQIGFSSAQVCKVERIRKINGERVIFDIDYFDNDIVTGITEEVASDSIYQYLEHEQNFKIGFCRKEITVVHANELEKKELDMLDYDLLVCVKSNTFLEDGTPFQYTISKHRPDKFQFVDFVRRI